MNTPLGDKTKSISNTLDTFGVIQHISEANHMVDNNLELIVTQNETELIGYKVGERISNPGAILMTMDIKKMSLDKYDKSRKLANVNIEKLKSRMT